MEALETAAALLGDRAPNGPGRPPPQPSPVATGEGEPRSGWEGAGNDFGTFYGSRPVQPEPGEQM